jgi:hypothetical protein
MDKGRVRRRTVTNQPSSQPTRAPIQWRGIVYALAANLLLVTLGETLARQFGLATNLWLLTGVVAPLLAGVLTAYYTGARGGIHAFIGALLSIPIFGLFIFPNAWQLAIFAGAFCTLGGAFMEIVRRRRG